MNDIIHNPGPNWVERLRSGNRVWLVKENQIADIDFPYDPPEPGYKTGRIGVKRWAIAHSWFIDSNGCGIDGSLLMLPIEGELADNPAPLEETVIRQLRRVIEKLERRVEQLELSAIFDERYGI